MQKHETPAVRFGAWYYDGEVGSFVLPVSIMDANTHYFIVDVAMRCRGGQVFPAVNCDYNWVTSPNTTPEDLNAYPGPGFWEKTWTVFHNWPDKVRWQNQTTRPALVTPSTAYPAPSQYTGQHAFVYFSLGPGTWRFNAVTAPAFPESHGDQIDNTNFDGTSVVIAEVTPYAF